MQSIKVFILALSSICCLGQSNEYQFAQVVLERFANYEVYRILVEPENAELNRFLTGFNASENYSNNFLDFRTVKFNYTNAHITKWDENLSQWGDKNDRIEFVQQFKDIQKVKPWEPDKYRSFLRISNPAFSQDGKYAIIFFEHFSNVSSMESEGTVIIFIKVGNAWLYFSEFSP